jgi:hypothetical protein
MIQDNICQIFIESAPGAYLLRNFGVNLATLFGKQDHLSAKEKIADNNKTL